MPQSIVGVRASEYPKKISPAEKFTKKEPGPSRQKLAQEKTPLPDAQREERGAGIQVAEGYGGALL